LAGKAVEKWGVGRGRNKKYYVCQWEGKEVIKKRGDPTKRNS